MNSNYNEESVVMKNLSHVLNENEKIGTLRVILKKKAKKKKTKKKNNVAMPFANGTNHS